MLKAAAASVVPDASKPPTKANLVVDLVNRGDGASLAELCEATDWLPHTCRAFITGLRKRGVEIARAKRDDGTTFYRAAAAKAQV
jgi:hypothetical protein